MAGIAGLVLSALLVSVTAAGVFRYARPQIALAVAPYDARARAGLAQQLLSSSQAPSAETIRLASEYARDAYRSDPTAVAALRVMGFVADLQGRRLEARRLLAYAETITKRDMLTELWLIEDRVAADDIAGALRHYDTIMRTSEEVKPVLYPILTNATQTPEIARQVNRILLARPNWWRNFLTYYLGAGNDAAAFATVFQGMLDWSDEQDRELATILLGRLSGAGRHDLAWAAYVDVRGLPARQPGLLRDGNFRVERRLPPFDWSFAEDGELIPDRRLRDGSDQDFVLYVPAGSSVAGDVARQLLRLPPGRYRAEALVGSVAEDALRRPLVRIECAGQPARRLAETDFPPADAEARRLGMEFSVPSGCANQWFAIRVKGSLDRGVPEWPWIGSISLRRI
ncbi:MAG: hypothetical protein KF780_02090 [Sphingomonas sp.]|nr:hypothetical protein [Sphingomonas sp.]